MSSRLIVLLFVLLNAALACADDPKLGTDKIAPPSALEQAVAHPERTPENTGRDADRHPLQTLEFFGVAADMTVVELWPGGGWYTEILAPLLHANGRLIAAGFDPQASGESGRYLREGAMNFNDKMAADESLYGRVEITILAPPTQVEIAPPNSADAVLSFRNAHSWLADGTFSEVLKAVHKALKADGIFGIEEHRADPQAQVDPKVKNGYVNEAVLIAEVEKAGFALLAKSEINANPLDTRNHPRGVWTLPPTLALGEKDLERYQKIGESDRMTLRFRKR